MSTQPPTPSQPHNYQQAPIPHSPDGQPGNPQPYAQQAGLSEQPVRYGQQGQQGQVPYPQGTYGQGPAGQPVYPGTGEPNNYLVLAIIGLFVFLPLAIPALIYSLQVSDKWRYGDHAGALASSRKARFWGLLSIIAPIVLVLVGALLLGLVFAVWGPSMSDSYGVY